MGLKICSIASGSTGNCTYISTQSTTILVDIGIPFTRAEKCLQLLGRGTETAVLVTHAHTDHISGVPQFAKRNGVYVYCHEKSAECLYRKGCNADRLVEFTDGDFLVGDILVTPFKVSHDVPCVGYVFWHNGKQIGVVTDIGHVTRHILDILRKCSLVLIESNHDECMLEANKNYSRWLKNRILSDSGHLSNSACAEACTALAAAGVKQFILAHLSRENNYPELALSAVGGALAESGIEGVDLEAAPPDKMSGLFEII